MDEDQDQTEGQEPSQTPGVEDAGAADPQGQGEGQEDQPQDQGTEQTDAAPVDPKAFAKRLAAERQKMRAEIEAEVRASVQPQAPAQPQQPPVTVDAYAEQIAEQLGLTPEAARAMAVVALRQQALEQQQQRILEQAEEASIKATDKTFDRAAADAVRTDFQKRYGITLSISDAWQMARNQQHIAQSTRAAEQRALAQADANRRAGTAAPSGGGGKPTIADLPKSDFEALVQRVKAGGRVGA